MVSEPESSALKVEPESQDKQTGIDVEVKSITAPSQEPTVLDELEQARQKLESARDENSELAARIQRLEAVFEEQERSMELQDKKLSEMKQQLENAAPGE